MKIRTGRRLPAQVPHAEFPASPLIVLRQHSRRRRLALLAAVVVALVFIVVAAAQPIDPASALESRVKNLETARDVLLGVCGTTLIGTVVVIVVGWFRFVRRADQLARRHVDRLVEVYPGAVERLVQEYEIEARLRREAKVAVISDALDLQALLREHGFRNLKTILVADARAATLLPYAAVVLGLTGGLSQQEATAVIQGHQRDIFLAYSTAPGRLDLPAGRTTFANSPITLYARLMELLKFHEARQRAA
jgi:hypothetical protein